LQGFAHRVASAERSGRGTGCRRAAESVVTPFGTGGSSAARGARRHRRTRVGGCQRAAAGTGRPGPIGERAGTSRPRRRARTEPTGRAGHGAEYTWPGWPAGSRGRGWSGCGRQGASFRPD